MISAFLHSATALWCAPQLVKLRLSLFLQSPNPQSPIPQSAIALHRPGISLIEVLISLFVLLFGLMGIAALLPVGSHYVVKGDQLDRAAVVSQAAAGDMVARGMLKPQAWYRYRQGVGHGSYPARPFFDSRFPDPVPFPAIAIDPMGVAAADTSLTGVDRLTAMNFFPPPPVGTSYPGVDRGWIPLSGLPPVARVTLPVSLNPLILMPNPIAEVLFQSRDDLSFSIPEQGDKPANLLYDDFDHDNSASTPPIPLRRQWQGEYSWLVTIAPAYTDTDGDGDLDLATGNIDHLTGSSGFDLRHDVSIVVFFRRDLTFPTAGTTEFNERSVSAVTLSPSFGGGEIQLQDVNPNKLGNIRQGEWLMLYGTYPINAPLLQRRWFIQWYQIISIGPEVVNGTLTARDVSLKGRDWPWPVGANIGAGLFRGAIAVYTQSMKLEGDSPWALE